jgi:hypothetical protein
MTNTGGSGWAAQIENQSFKGRALALTGRAMGGANDKLSGSSSEKGS